MNKERIFKITRVFLFPSSISYEKVQFLRLINTSKIILHPMKILATYIHGNFSIGSEIKYLDFEYVYAIQQLGYKLYKNSYFIY